MLALVAQVLVADSVRRIVVAPAETIAVTEMGAGAPVVLVPGLFGSAYTYRKVVPLVAAQGERAIVIEPLGIGVSSRPEKGDYSLGAQAGRIAAVLDTLGVRGAVVVAHSTAASEAMRLAVRRPDLVAGIVSIEGGPAERTASTGFRNAMKFAPWIKLFGGVKLVRWKIRHLLRESSGDTTWVTDSVVSGYTAAAARNLDATLKAYLAMADAREREKLRPHLGEIRCPLLLLVGSAPSDGAPHADEVTLLATALPRFSVDTVRGAGNFLQEERPDVVAAAIRAAVAAAAVADP